MISCFLCSFIYVNVASIRCFYFAHAAPIKIVAYHCMLFMFLHILAEDALPSLSSVSSSFQPVPLSSLFLAKQKHKDGSVDRVVDPFSVIGKGMFVSNMHAEKFVGLRISMENDAPGMPEIVGILEKPFGKSGKFVVAFKSGIKSTDVRVENRKLRLSYDVNVLDVTRRKWNTEET